MNFSCVLKGAGETWLPGNATNQTIRSLDHGVAWWLAAKS
ncbi:hypothetical protein CLV77_0563 [Brevirhabdus pacifica]|nr:hypothetical protein CLV77_0563 [Brevirhabdus pacifica]